MSKNKNLLLNISNNKTYKEEIYRKKINNTRQIYSALNNNIKK